MQQKCSRYTHIRAHPQGHGPCMGNGQWAMGMAACASGGALNFPTKMGSIPDFTMSKTRRSVVLPGIRSTSMVEKRRGGKSSSAYDGASLLCTVRRSVTQAHRARAACKTHHHLGIFGLKGFPAELEHLHEFAIPEWALPCSDPCVEREREEERHEQQVMGAQSLEREHQGGGGVADGAAVRQRRLQDAMAAKGDEAYEESLYDSIIEEKKGPNKRNLKGRRPSAIGVRRPCNVQIQEAKFAPMTSENAKGKKEAECGDVHVCLAQLLQTVI